MRTIVARIDSGPYTEELIPIEGDHRFSVQAGTLWVNEREDGNNVAVFANNSWLYAIKQEGEDS